MYITITETDVITKLSGPELDAMQSAALQTDQEPPLPGIITQVVKEVRGYVAACERNVLGAGETIPDELLGAAISRIRFELATRLPEAGLLSEDRRTANTNAIRLLESTAACKFLVIGPETPAEEQASGSAEVISKTCRRFDRSQMDGL